MNISTIGYNYHHDSSFYIKRPNGSEDYLFLLIRSPAIIELDEQIEVKSNSIILFDVGSPQNYKASNTTFINDWFHFTIDNYEWFNSLNIPFNKLISDLDLSMINKLSAWIQEIANEKIENSKYSSQISSMKLKCFFMSLSQILSNKNNSQFSYKSFQVMQEIRNDIFNQPYQKASINTVALKANMSISYFQHIYKQLFNTTYI